MVVMPTGALRGNRDTYSHAALDTAGTGGEGHTRTQDSGDDRSYVVDAHNRSIPPHGVVGAMMASL